MDEKTLSKLLAAGTAYQIAAGLFATFAPFGFDHRSSLGLSIEHLFLLVTSLVMVAAAQVVIEIRFRAWRTLLAHLLLLAVLVVTFLAVEGAFAGRRTIEPAAQETAPY